MCAGEIRALAERSGIAPGVSWSDLRRGVAGPGRFITQALGCGYVGVDYSPSAIAIARVRARSLPCRFEVAHVPPLPGGTFDVVLLLETMLAFPDKGDASSGGRPGAHGRRAVRVHPGGRPASHRVGARAHARRRHGLAHPARGHARVAGARRADRSLAGRPQPVPPRHGGVVDRRVRSRRERPSLRRSGAGHWTSLCWPPTGSGATG